jgi:hypothetical protein
MHRSVIAGLIVLASAATFAAGFGLKPGLWEMHIVKQVRDGRDMTAQLATGAAQMQQAMASMTPEQRARLEAMMKARGTESIGSGIVRMCVSPEMASRDTPIVDRDGHCQPSTVNRSGNTTTFEVSCKTPAGEMTGKGESVNSGDLITTKMDVTTRDSKGETHVIHSEHELKYLGADCGDVKPLTPPK